MRGHPYPFAPNPDVGVIYHSAIGPAVPRRGNAISRFIGRHMLNLMGWHLHGELPNRGKFIIAVAPHSSNIDFLLTMWVIMSLGLQCSFLAKASLFRLPVGWIMRFFGGIPVDRSSRHGVVEQMTERFRQSSKLVLGIAPEGTRSAVDRWRSGFAQIAQAANIPVQPAIIDYARKCVTFATLIEDVGDVQNTVLAMQSAARQGSPRRG